MAELAWPWEYNRHAAWNIYSRAVDQLAMLKKIVQIKNVGKFRDCTARGDVQFRRNTLFFAENGRGKTTLCDVFRSLQSGEPDAIQGRATLGAANAPKVELLLESGVIAKFDSGAWSEMDPNLVIYDSRFVHENIFAGDVVAHEHKKNLYRVMVGEQGVTLARRVEELSESIKEAHSKLKEAEVDAAKHLSGSIELRDFIKLEKDEDVERKEAEQQKVVNALQQAAEIDTAPVPIPLALPVLPSELETTIAKTLGDVSKDAEEKVRAHLESHMRRTDESWLAKGHALVRDTTCPFCAQGLSSSDVFPTSNSRVFGRRHSEPYRAVSGRDARCHEST